MMEIERVEYLLMGLIHAHDALGIEPDQTVAAYDVAA